MTGYTLTSLTFSYEPGQVCPVPGCGGMMTWMVAQMDPILQICEECSTVVNVDTDQVWQKEAV